VTPFPKLLAGVANLATPVLSRFVGASRSDLIKMLEKDSEELAKLSSDFVSRLSKIKVASFIEQKATPPADTRVSLLAFFSPRTCADKLSTFR